MMESVLAWHFVGDRLRNGDPVPPNGKWLEWSGPLFMCKSGLHASIDPFDALQYAPGPILCRVECSGEIIKGGDKLVCSRRRIIQRKDATKGLGYFARMQALSVAHLWDCPDVVLEFLMTGENRDAARAAAWVATWAGASAAARDAARDAAWAAAWAAAQAATWAAASPAFSAAARDGWNALVSEAFGLERRVNNGR